MKGINRRFFAQVVDGDTTRSTTMKHGSSAIDTRLVLLNSCQQERETCGRACGVDGSSPTRERGREGD